VDLFVGSAGEANRLYHNIGDGFFERVLTGAIATDVFTSSMANGVVWGDYDNDGDLDLFVGVLTSLRNENKDDARDRFYRNDGGGAFTKETEGNWVNGTLSAEAAAWADYDNDGLLDLYVCNRYEKGVKPNYLYHNDGDGSMTDVGGDSTTAEIGSHGCTWGDYDNDGDLDLFVAGQKSMQFRNNGDGTLERVTTGAPVPYEIKDIGIALGDYDNDGDLDLVVTGSSGDRLYRNVISPVDGSRVYVRVTGDVFAPAWPGLSHTPVWGDFDNDGFLDLYISRYNSQPNLLFRNLGDGTFESLTDSPAVSDLGKRACAEVADYDNDGDLDLVVSDATELSPVALYRNEYIEAGGTNNSLLIHLEGVVSNRSAIGAKVRVEATIDGKNITQLREISGGSGFGGQNDLRAHFGLGDATTADNVRIEWPSGIVQELSNVSANQILTVVEEYVEPLFEGIPVPGFLGWFYSEWFGYYNTDHAPWIFHAEHGFIYRDPDSTIDNIFAYDDAMVAWWYSNQTIYPSIYAFGPPTDLRGTDIESEWLFCFEGETDPRVFYVLTGPKAGSYLYYSP
jgi:hypothetical protein